MLQRFYRRPVLVQLILDDRTTRNRFFFRAAAALTCSGVLEENFDTTEQKKGFWRPAVSIEAGTKEKVLASLGTHRTHPLKVVFVPRTRC